MSVSDDFNDANEMLAARRTSDEAILTAWLDKHSGLTGFFKKLQSVKADGFAFSVVSGFEPKADELSDGYVSPKLTRALSFTTIGKTETLRLDVTLSSEWTLTGFETAKTGTAKNALLVELDGWISGLNAANPDLNIEAHMKRAGAQADNTQNIAPTKAA